MHACTPVKIPGITISSVSIKKDNNWNFLGSDQEMKVSYSHTCPFSGET